MKPKDSYILRLAGSRILSWFTPGKRPRMIWGYRDAAGWRLHTRVSDTVFMYHPERIRIADNVFIWHHTILDGVGGIEIGEGTQIGGWVGVFTHSSHIAIRLYGRHYQEVDERDKKGYPVSGVRIGRYVFIGAASKIFPGVRIGDGAVVSPGAYVYKDVADFQVVAGNPARVFGDTREMDAQYLDDPQLKAWHQEWQAKA